MKWKKEVNQLNAKEDLIRQEIAELREADRRASQGRYYLKALRNASTAIQNQITKAGESE